MPFTTVATIGHQLGTIYYLHRCRTYVSIKWLSGCKYIGRFYSAQMITKGQVKVTLTINCK